MATLKVTIGDYSDDGHGKCDDFIIDFSHDKETLLANYEKNKELFQMDPEEDFCCDYEDNTISDDYIQRLIDHGLDIYLENKDSDVHYLGNDEFFAILMFLYGYGLDDFTWTVVNFESLHCGGGYGLYY